jgi:epoxyqueuosine reductase
MNLLHAQIKTWAGELGFDACRIARVHEASHAHAFRAWLATGQHGGMSWLERTPERRCDPRQVLPGCQSLICLALNYFPGHAPLPNTPARDYRIARYAWNEDYHHLIDRRLRDFNLLLQSHGGTQKPCVDTGPVLERDFASASGLGWNGKSTMQIHPRLGTWFFLAEILTTLELTPDMPLENSCGKCTRCITACPTRAITAPHQLDARRCISYLTIEHPGPIPLEFRDAIGDRIYGCDACLETCPWNRFAVESRELAFHARHAIFEKRARDFLDLNDEAFCSLFAQSPIKRLKRPRFLRNVCVALGNAGTPDDLPALTRAATDPDPLISEHAAWAVNRIRARDMAVGFRLGVDCRHRPP